MPFLYFSHFARLAEEHFGYQGITPVQHGHGGWTAAQALKVVDKEVVDEAGPNDLTGVRRQRPELGQGDAGHL